MTESRIECCATCQCYVPVGSAIAAYAEIGLTDLCRRDPVPAWVAANAWCQSWRGGGAEAVSGAEAEPETDVAFRDRLRRGYVRPGTIHYDTIDKAGGPALDEIASYYGVTRRNAAKPDQAPTTT